MVKVATKGVHDADGGVTVKGGLTAKVRATLVEIGDFLQQNANAVGNKRFSSSYSSHNKNNDSSLKGSGDNGTIYLTLTAFKTSEDKRGMPL